MISLDWDKIGDSTMLKRLVSILTYDFIKSIDIRQSPSLDGYHIYIETFNFVSPALVYRFRFNHFDDTRRLCKDMINKEGYFRGVSFNYKIDRLGNKHPEVKILKYERKNTSSEWQKIQINPSSQAQKNSKLELTQQ